VKRVTTSLPSVGPAALPRLIHDPGRSTPVSDRGRPALRRPPVTGRTPHDQPPGRGAFSSAATKQSTPRDCRSVAYHQRRQRRRSRPRLREIFDVPPNYSVPPRGAAALDVMSRQVVAPAGGCAADRGVDPVMVEEVVVAASDGRSRLTALRGSRHVKRDLGRDATSGRRTTTPP
jgi:hypothetical protein